VSTPKLAPALAHALSTSERSAKIDSLKLSVLSAVDPNTYSVASARRLLDLAIDAIRSSAPPEISEKIVDPRAHLGPAEVKAFCALESVIEIIDSSFAALPDLTSEELVAAPLGDWVLILGAVWLRRVALVVWRKLGPDFLGEEWTGMLADSGEEVSAGDEWTSVIQDITLTKMLRGAAVAAACLVAAEDMTCAAGGEAGTASPAQDYRYVRFNKEEAADLVAALWEVSLTMESGGENKNELVASALSRHSVVARAVRNTPRLKTKAAERALGIRGSFSCAGFVLSLSRSPTHFSDPAPTREWCPFDIITGRPLPPWAPLRRCVVSGLLAAEITHPQPGEGRRSSRFHPWAEKWTFESPLGGTWARVPSLDLERFELLPAVPKLAEAPAPSQQPPDASPNPVPADPRAAPAMPPRVVDPRADPRADAARFAEAQPPSPAVIGSTARDAMRVVGGKRGRAEPSDANPQGSPTEMSTSSQLSKGSARSKRGRGRGRGRARGQRCGRGGAVADAVAAGGWAPDGVGESPMVNNATMSEAATGNFSEHHSMGMPSGPSRRGNAGPTEDPFADSPGGGRAGESQTTSIPGDGAAAMPLLPPVTGGARGDGGAGSGQRIWQGRLHVRGNRNDMVVPCVAIALNSKGRTQMVDAVGWPTELYCESSILKPTTTIWPRLDEPASQWYARLAPVEENGAEMNYPKLVELVKVMIQRQLAFELECNEGGAPGTLYLWGMDLIGVGYSLLAVFRPHPEDNLIDGILGP